MKDVEKLVDSNGVVLQIVDGAARDMIAAEYDATASYAVGDYCIYNDHYYKCKTAIPSGGETWDATHWDATTLGAEDRAIKQSLANLDNIFSKSYTITASSERAFIKDLATQAYSYMISKSLPFMLVNASWEGNNTGYMIISSTRRFQVQVGDSMSLGILNAAGTDLAQLRSVTTTTHP